MKTRSSVDSLSLSRFSAKFVLEPASNADVVAASRRQCRRRRRRRHRRCRCALKAAEKLGPNGNNESLLLLLRFAFMRFNEN